MRNAVQQDTKIAFLQVKCGLSQSSRRVGHWRAKELRCRLSSSTQLYIPHNPGSMWPTAFGSVARGPNACMPGPRACPCVLTRLLRWRTGIMTHRPRWWLQNNPTHQKPCRNHHCTPLARWRVYTADAAICTHTHSSTGASTYSVLACAQTHLDAEEEAPSCSWCQANCRSLSVVLPAQLALCGSPHAAATAGAIRAPASSCSPPVRPRRGPCCSPLRLFLFSAACYDGWKGQQARGASQAGPEEHWQRAFAPARPRRHKPAPAASAPRQPATAAAAAGTPRGASSCGVHPYRAAPPKGEEGRRIYKKYRATKHCALLLRAPPWRPRMEHLFHAE